MWTQYTREKPARPGWTIATMAIALAATIGLAQLQVSAHKPVTWKAAVNVKTDSCPITFQLPDVLKWSKQSSGLLDNLISGDSEIVYVASEDGDPVCRVNFFCGPSTILAAQMHLKDVGEEPAEAYSVTIAGEKGVAMVFPKTMDDRNVVWCHSERIDETLMSFVVVTKKNTTFALKLAHWICESAQAD
ncbi:MAG TPA: hypothetical protein P5081_09905 [Phycisphaerae bacterium]|nr:hypothetical protein [Phycisphaerae bacterium]HRW53191.1 hypothetical protein [Phycisphaerae bacterium]